jgi:hypothetical protein
MRNDVCSVWKSQVPCLAIRFPFHRVFSNPNITVHLNTEAVDVISNSKGQMEGLLVRENGEEKKLQVRGFHLEWCRC